MTRKIEIISAPSILGLKPTGVQELGEALLKAGLAEHLKFDYPVVKVRPNNKSYSAERDSKTKCINLKALRAFSVKLSSAVSKTIDKNRFAFVLGGDCSILLGIMPALKVKGNYGLIFFDAHADFYEPEKSATGEVADMELGFMVGHGPEVLSNINGLNPYVLEKNVVHIGQRDEEETKHYGSRNIRDSSVKCINVSEISATGLKKTAADIINHIQGLNLDGVWIHYDTDVLSDDINPAVDYRLPGGLQFSDMEYFIGELLVNCNVAGLSLTIFNPRLDTKGEITKKLTVSLGKAFKMYIQELK